MKGILYSQFNLLRRKPGMFLVMTLFIIIFSLVLGGNNGGTYNAYIPVYSEMDSEKTDHMLDLLNEYGTQNFTLVEQEELMKDVREGSTDAGIILNEENYEFIIAAEQPTFILLEQNVQKAYAKFLQEERVVQADNVDSETVIKELNEPMFTVETKSFVGEDTWVYDSSLQTLFGFAVFFVIYTIAYNVVNILTAKQNGIWDRLILSPAKKWEMYVSILLYAFILGYIQVVIVFAIFQYGLGVDFYDGFGKTLIILIPYVLCIVSLSVLIAGLSKTLKTFNAIIPIVSVSLAMIGGAYWPIEIVSNQFMLTLSKLDPIYYVMEAFKAVTVYGEPLTANLFPISILLLMSVIAMGLGLNLMERRN